MKILTVIGARPQFIKAAVISRIVRDRHDISEVIVHTGQHFDKNMSSVFFQQMDIPRPDYNLGINSMNHGKMTGKMIQEIEKVIIKEKPDIVLVYGDTNSTLAGALAASKLKKKIAHVEAGLRSFNNLMPEEINRILTDRISDYLFCPTSAAVENLGKEGIEEKKIILCGDVMYDALLHYKPQAAAPDFDLPEKFLLATVHRSENTDTSEKLHAIFSALNRLSEEHPVIIPLHPRTAQFIDKRKYPLILFKKPLGYFELLYLLENCLLVLTDSGGLQKETYMMKKPCVTLREQTEWIELVENGFNVLASADYEKIISLANLMLASKHDFSRKLYGDGKAGIKIINRLYG